MGSRAATRVETGVRRGRRSLEDGPPACLRAFRKRLSNRCAGRGTRAAPLSGVLAAQFADQAVDLVEHLDDARPQV
jgi:hypothetical protein